MQMEQDIPASALVRVYLLGPLEVYKRDQSGTWKLVSEDKWKNSRPARSVLKRLLVQPGRRLSREQLADDVWSESGSEPTGTTVYSAISLIRGVIGKPLVKLWVAAYEIAGQTLVWTDIDAASSLLKSAENQGYTGPLALACLERALIYLERGELLEGVYGKWCYAFRERSEDMLKQCRFWLAQIYESQGKLWQAGEQYRALCAAMPPNEQALQHWIALLNLQGKSQEALKCYQDVTEMWEEQGYSPSDDLQDMIASEQDREEQPMNVSRRSFLYIGAGLLASQYVSSDALIPLGQPSNRELLKEMVDRNFPQGVTYNLLSSNIKTMNFRDEWQYIVNNLVGETKTGLRAMVFDVELTRWWNSIAGQVYMMTNMELLKRRVPVKRIFILSSFDARLRMNALLNAYVHHKIGIDVKVCTVTGFQNSVPFTPDMFSVHDNLFVTLYYFSPAKPLTNLLLEDKHINEFGAFYDELFRDDRLCTDIETVLADADCGESFWASTKMQLDLLQRLEKIGSTMELARNRQI